MRRKKREEGGGNVHRKRKMTLNKVLPLQGYIYDAEAIYHGACWLTTTHCIAHLHCFVWEDL